MDIITNNSTSEIWMSMKKLLYSLWGQRKVGREPTCTKSLLHIYTETTASKEGVFYLHFIDEETNN